MDFTTRAHCELSAASKRAAVAVAERDALIRQSYPQHSLRDIGAAVGLSAAGVRRIILRGPIRPHLAPIQPLRHDETTTAVLTVVPIVCRPHFVAADDVN